MKSFLTLQSAETVLGHIRAFPPVPEEEIPLDEAWGRRLARDVAAPHDLPGFRRSTMDGWAVRAADVFGATEGSPAPLRHVGDCPMGGAPDFSLSPGETARILTGGMLPEGADAVVMIEHSRPAGSGLVELARGVAPGDNVLLADDDAACGDVVLAAGTLLRPQEIGLLAAFGMTSVPVRRRPRVAILSTGDEVVPAEADPGPGQVRDVNGHALAALCREAGGQAERIGLIRDDPALLRRTVAEALESFDVVAVSGGSSAGMRDHTAEVFASLAGGALLAHGVAVSPGKPFILARSGDRCLMGLPGHVTSAQICARIFLLPLLRRMQGETSTAPLVLTAEMSRSVASSQGRRDFIRVRLTPKPAGSGGARLLAEPQLAPSGLLTGLVAADGLAVCPENREGFAAGDVAEVIPLR